MADVTYRIIIEGMGGGGSDAPRTTAATPSGEELSPKGSGGNDAGNPLGKFYKTMKGSAAVGLALKYANTVATTYINRVELRTGRSTYQEQLNYTKQTTMRGLGIGVAILGGVVTGNPLLALGGVVSAFDWALDIGISQGNLNIARAVNNVSIGMANIRAGAGGDRHGKANY